MSLGYNRRCAPPPRADLGQRKSGAIPTVSTRSTIDLMASIYPFRVAPVCLPELFDAERAESVYTRAARDFQACREQGVLAQD